MIQRLLITAAILVCTVSATSAPAPEAKQGTPFLIARLQPADKLLDDAKFLAGKFGTPEAAEKFKTKMLDYLGAESIAEMGIESKKPVGVYAICLEDCIEPAFVLMMPVADESKMLGYVGKFEVKAEKLEDSLYSLAIPDQPLPTFVRFANNYAYVTNSARSALAPALLLAPAAAFVANESGLVSVAIRPDLIQEPLRKVLLAQLTDTIKEIYGEFDADDDYPELTEVQAKSTIRWFEMICEGGQEVTLRVTYDRPSGDLAFATTIVPKPGSKLAISISTVATGSSLFTKMLGDRGAFNYAGNWIMDADEAKKVGEIVAETGAETLVEWLGIDDSDETSKAQVMTFCKSLVPTAEAGQVDIATSLRLVGEQYVWLGATRLKDGQKVDEALRKMIAAIPEDKRGKLTLDAQTIDNVKLHELELEEDDDETEKLFGKSAKMWLAIKDDAFIFGYGKDAGKAVAEAMSGVAAAPAPNFQVDVSVKKLKSFLDVISEDESRELEKYFGKDADRVSICNGSLTGGNTLQMKASINLQLIVGLILADEEDEAAIAIPREWLVPAALTMPNETRLTNRAGTLAHRRD